MFSFFKKKANTLKFQFPTVEEILNQLDSATVEFLTQSSESFDQGIAVSDPARISNVPEIVPWKQIIRFYQVFSDDKGLNWVRQDYAILKNNECNNDRYDIKFLTGDHAGYVFENIRPVGENLYLYLYNALAEIPKYSTEDDYDKIPFEGMLADGVQDFVDAEKVKSVYLNIKTIKKINDERNNVMYDLCAKNFKEKMQTQKLQEAASTIEEKCWE